MPTGSRPSGIGVKADKLHGINIAGVRAEPARLDSSVDTQHMSKQRRALGALIASVSLVAIVGSTAIANHHLENEGGGTAPAPTPRPTPKPTPVRILVVEPAQETMPVGAELTLEARICNEKGRKCKPAGKARWSVNKKAVLAIAPKRGKQVVATGLSKGIANVTAKQAGLSGKARIKITEPAVEDTAVETDPGGDPADAETDAGVGAATGLELRLEPEEGTFEIGQAFVLTALGCPDASAEAGAAGFIQNSGRADGCEPVNVLDLGVDEQTGLTLHGIYEHAVLLSIGSFAGPTGAAAHFIGPAVVTQVGATAPSLFSADREYAGPKLGDFDADGDVDGDDWLVYFADGLALDGPPITPDEGQAAADLSGDGLVDATDVAIHDALIERDGGTSTAASGAQGADDEQS